jgi:plastocyanin
MRRLILPLLATAVLLSACGSDDEETSGSTTPASSGSGTRVAMKDLKFIPADLTVDAGETVTWVNEESVPHNVVNAEEGQEPKSELFGEGGTYEFTPREPGKIEYVCTIHPGMEGTLTVR